MNEENKKLNFRGSKRKQSFSLKSRNDRGSNLIGRDKEKWREGNKKLSD